MKNVNDVVVTDAMRASYKERWITSDATIQAFEYVKAQTTKRLNSIIKFTSSGRLSYGSAAIKKLSAELSPDGSYINPNWVLGNVATELYIRHEMDDSTYLRIQELND